MPSNTTGKGAAFRAYLAKKRPLIEAYLSEHAPAPLGDETVVGGDLERYLYGPLKRFMASGGKRTRPVLVLLGCEAVGGTATSALSCACAIEDFQSAALIHDDIADKGTLRRGAPCMHVTEGVGIAINVADLALIIAQSRILRERSLSPELRVRILEEFAAMEERTLEGQALDLGWVRDGRWDLSVDDYLCMASHKTAFYSAACPLSIGAICGGGTDEQVEALRTFGMGAGLAFQLQDDLLNLVGNAKAQGKDFRSDITEGKRTMAVTWSLERLQNGQRDELIEILSSHATDAATLEHAVGLMESVGAIEGVRDYAHSVAESARRELDGIELADDMCTILDSMADFFVERTG